jgi:hypothetical protein
MVKKMGDTRSAYKLLVGKPFGKWMMKGQRQRQKVNIKMKLERNNLMMMTS